MYKISKEQMRALDGSIEKWNLICNQHGLDQGRTNYPLCQLNIADRQCEQCIVYLETGEHFCRETPYEVWIKHHRKHHRNFHLSHKIYKSCECPECNILANDEYKFLKDLKTRCVVTWWKTYTDPIIVFIRNIICI